jgi:hypothetical protein
MPCPDNFQSNGNGRCVAKCPILLGFSNSGNRCVVGNTLSFDLVPLGDTMTTEHTAELLRVEMVASDTLQDQEDLTMRDYIRRGLLALNPTNDESIKNTEKQKIKLGQASQISRQLLTEYNDALAQSAQQSHIVDTITGIKNKVLSIKDGMQYSVSAFSKHLEKIRNQININKVQKPVQVNQAELTFSWIDTILDAFLAISVILLIGVLVYKFAFRGNIVQNGQVIGHT